jgi:serine-type D-Ala-D-Ala carboxypeptidase/endopeptidase
MRALASIALLVIACGGGGAGQTVERPPPEPAPPADDGLESRIDALVEPLIASEWLQAVSIAVIEPDRVRTFHYGHVAGPGSPAPDDRTIYEIGSISKVFTALVLADMIGRGEVTLETAVSELLPSVEVATYEGTPITLETLAVHRSGLPRLPSDYQLTDLDDPYAGYRVEDLYATVATEKLRSAPGTRFEYSNLGYGLLGHALARKAGTTWPELVRARIAGPLGMTDTAVELGDRASRFATGHTADGEVAAPWTFTDATAGAGALRSTLSDMSAFVRANLAGEPEPLAAAMRLARTPRADADGGARIGLGWLLDADGVVWHNGGTGGYRSFAGFDPEAGTGVVVLASTASPLADVVAAKVRVAMAGESPTIELPATVAVAPEVLEGYVGSYSMPLAGLEIEITRDGDRLYAQPTDQPRFRLYPDSERRFRLRVVEAAVEFDVDDQGRATGLYLEQNGARIPAVRKADEDHEE